MPRINLEGYEVRVISCGGNIGNAYGTWYNLG